MQLRLPIQAGRSMEHQRRTTCLHEPPHATLIRQREDKIPAPPICFKRIEPAVVWPGTVEITCQQTRFLLPALIWPSSVFSSEEEPTISAIQLHLIVVHNIPLARDGQKAAPVDERCCHCARAHHQHIPQVCCHQRWSLEGLAIASERPERKGSGDMGQWEAETGFEHVRRPKAGCHACAKNMARAIKTEEVSRLEQCICEPAICAQVQVRAPALPSHTQPIWGRSNLPQHPLAARIDAIASCHQCLMQ